MWVRTHHGILLNLSLYKTLEAIKLSTDEGSVVVNGDIPIFEGTPAECVRVIERIEEKLEILDLNDLSRAPTVVNGNFG